LRNILPNGLLSDYQRDITGAARAVYRPEDAYIGDLVSALGAINSGRASWWEWICSGSAGWCTSHETISFLRLAGCGPAWVVTHQAIETLAWQPRRRRPVDTLLPEESPLPPLKPLPAGEG